MYINGIKYACATCIKGHRSSHCNHVDRPLFEIRKKGRPVTQCTFCRDLRKTKQVHIKCVCNDKKESTGIQQPVFYHVNEQNLKTPSFSLSQDTQSTSTQVTRDPFVAPLCPTTAPPIKEENASYSWAMVTSPTTNHLKLESSSPPLRDINNYVGFTFHKPSSQRFLDGQPRKRKSNKRNSSNAIPPNYIETVDFNQFTPPATVSPHPPSSNSSASTAVQEPMNMYLTEQLDVLSQDVSPFSTKQNDLMTGTNTEELTAILNNVLSSQPDPPIQRPPVTRSHCGSFVPNTTCSPSQGPGESVIITITPLDQQQQQKTTTQIVACYCGQQCTCPGCLVHPGNFFLGNDPYTNPAIPSSSSSCYGSDEEEHHYLQPFP